MSGLRKLYADPEGAAEACATHILSLLEAAVDGSGRARLAISGGSTPKLMFAHMAQPGFDWTQVQLFWVDERAVPPSHAESNYRMAEEHLVRPAGIPHRNVCRIHAELEPQRAA